MIKGKPDVSAFLDGAAVEKPSKPPAESAMPTPKGTVQKDTGKPKVAKHQKLLELPAPIYTALKDRAYQEFKATGTRVTETQIILDALRSYLGMA